MRRQISILLALCMAAFAFDFSADTVLSSELQELLISVPSHEQFPNASFYILIDSTIVRMLPDGGYEREKYFLAKVYTYRGKKDLSNYKIRYRPEFEELELLRARTINPGTVKSVDTTQVNDIIPSFYSKASTYTKIKQRVVSLPAFSESSAVEIHYRIRSKAKPPFPFGGLNLLVDEQPARKVFYAMSFPQGAKPRWLSVSGAPEPTISAGQVQWIMNDWAGIQYEPQMPPLREIIPTILFTASKNWEYETEKIGAKILTSAVPDERIQKLADSLIVEGNTMKTVEAILFHLQDKFDHISVSPNLVGYEPNSAPKILGKGFGDSRDLTVLLLALLKAANIEAYPALIASGGAMIYDIPTVYQFDRMVVYALIDGKAIYLDPVSQYADIGYIGAAQGEKAFIVAPGKAGLKDIPPIRADRNSVYFGYNMNIRDDGSATGTVVTEASGSPAMNLRAQFRHTKKRKKRQHIERAASNISNGAQIEGNPNMEGVEQNSGSVKVEFSINDPKALVIQDIMGILWMPGVPFEIFRLPDISKDERTFPLFIDKPLQLTSSRTFYFPNTYKVDYVPPVQHYESEVGKLSIDSQWGEHSLVINVSLELTKKRITDEDYEKIKQLVRAIAAKRYRIALLESRS